MLFCQAGSSEDEVESAGAGATRRGRPADSSSGDVTRYRLPEQVAVKVNTPPANGHHTPGATLKVSGCLAHRWTCVSACFRSVCF